MRNYITGSAVSLTLAFMALGVVPTFAQSQSEMNPEAATNFEVADKQMNKVYADLISKIDKESQEKLKIVQRAWLVYRDAQADLISDFDARGGSMAPMIYEGTRTELTKTRIENLKKVAKEYAE